MLSYESEYRLGRRGGRVRHSFHGYQAFIAITVTLALGLAFSIIGAIVFAISFALRTAWLLMSGAMTMVAAILSAPFLFARWVSRRFESRPHPLKPARLAIDDLA